MHLSICILSMNLRNLYCGPSKWLPLMAFVGTGALPEESCFCRALCCCYVKQSAPWVWRVWVFISVDEKITFLSTIPDCQVAKNYGNWPFWARGGKIQKSTVTLRKSTSKTNLKDDLLYGQLQDFPTWVSPYHSC